MKCIECGQEVINEIKRAPNRHMTSPNHFEYREGNQMINTVTFCSNTCADKRDTDRLEFFSNLDKNCSDCVKFRHEAYNGKLRVGRCLKKNISITIEPLQPSDRFDYETRCFEGRYGNHSRPQVQAS